MKSNEKFEMPKVEIILFDNEDIIVSSDEWDFVPASQKHDM